MSLKINEPSTTIINPVASEQVQGNTERSSRDTRIMAEAEQVFATIEGKLDAISHLPPEERFEAWNELFYGRV